MQWLQPETHVRMIRIYSGTRNLERGRAMMRDLVTTIVKAIVDYPNAVEVKEVDGERTTVIELRVAKEDVGKVIGKQGRIAEAIRVILGAAGAKIKRKIELEILEW